MREIRTSGLMSGVWETGRRFASAPAPDLDSTEALELSALEVPSIETNLDAAA